MAGRLKKIPESAVHATGGFTLNNSQPSNGQYITLGINGGSNWTFVTSAAGCPGGLSANCYQINETQIQSTAAQTVNQLASDLNASTDPNLLNTNGTGILNGTSGFVLKATGWGTYSSVGYASAIADVNGDGYGDIISGNTEGVDNNPVIFGKSTWPASTNISAAGWLNGYNGSDFTTTVPAYAAAGDINGDGIPDLIFGASSMTVNGNANAGEVYVVFGHKNSINNPWPTSAFNLNGL